MIRKLLILTLGLAALLPAADPKMLKDAKAKLAAKDFDGAIALLESGFKAGRPDPELRKAMSEAQMAYGDSFMYNDQLPPFMKYPNALRRYRLAISYDKSNTEAKHRADMIMAVYKQVEKAREKK